MSNDHDHDENNPHVIHVIHSGKVILVTENAKPAIDFGFSVGPITNKGGNKMPLNLTINNEQRILITLSPVDTAGKAVKISAITAVVTSGDATLTNPDGTTLTPGASSFQLVSGLDGPSIVSVSATQPDGTTISDTINLTVVDPDASTLGVTAGAISNKP
jgi:hypothetical protein